MRAIPESYVYNEGHIGSPYFADYPSTAENPRTFPNVFSGSSIAPHPSYRRANQYDLKHPRVIQWNFSVEHEFGASMVARATYMGSHTYNLIYSPGLLELNRRFSNSLTFSNHYTWAHNTTNALGTAPSSAIPAGGQGDNGNNVNNYYDIRTDYGNAYYTRRHRFVSTIVYELPFGRGRKYASDISRAANLAIGSWGVTGVTLLQTGPWLTPYFPTSLADPSGTNPSQRSVSQQRPDCVGGKTGYLDNPTTQTYFDVSAFSVPASNIGRYGTCGVGILEGPATATFSMSVGKTFSLTERIGFRYEAQFANLFNVLNRAEPVMNVASSAFGQITGSQFAEQAGPRTIQMMLRLVF
jgi:hypothetical protein